MIQDVWKACHQNSETTGCQKDRKHPLQRRTPHWHDPSAGSVGDSYGNASFVFLLFDFIVNWRQYAVVRVLACRVGKHLDVIEHVLPCSVARQVGPSPDSFAF